MLTSYNDIYIYKQLRSTTCRHSLVSITHSHQHTWSIHNSYMAKLCIRNIANISRGVFEFALNEVYAIFAQINAPRILPLLQVCCSVIIALGQKYNEKIYHNNDICWEFNVSSPGPRQTRQHSLKLLLPSKWIHSYIPSPQFVPVNPGTHWQRYALFISSIQVPSFRHGDDWHSSISWEG